MEDADEWDMNYLNTPMSNTPKLVIDDTPQADTRKEESKYSHIKSDDFASKVQTAEKAQMQSATEEQFVNKTELVQPQRQIVPEAIETPYLSKSPDYSKFNRADEEKPRHVFDQLEHSQNIQETAEPIVNNTMTNRDRESDDIK